MDTTVIVCFFLSLIQTAQSQPNLAALLGLGGFGDISESQTPGSGSCPYRAHADRRKFSQMVNNRLMTQECAPGTMFVLSKCSCDNIPSGGPGGGPMPGSNPRLEAAMGGGGDPLLSSLLSQLQGAFQPQPTRSPPPPIRNRMPMNSNQLNTRRQQVTSGVRPDQRRGGNVAGNARESHAAKSNAVQYNPDPSTGLTSVVDPSVLSNVLPPEILNVLGRSNNKPRSSGNPQQRATTRSPAGPTRLPASVQKMVNRASRPPTRRQSPPPTRAPSNDFGGMALPPGGLPPDVLKMLQQSIQPGAGRRGNSNRLNSKSPNSPTLSPRSNQRTSPSPRRTPSATRQPGPRQDPLAGLMAQIQGNRGPQQGPQPTRRPPGGPRQDPLAALLAGVSHSSRGPNRGPSIMPTRAPQRGPPRGSGGPPGGDPLAALLAGLGGRSGSPPPRGGSDPLASLLASMGGGSGPPSGGNSALAALLGGGSNSGSLSSPGGPLDLSSLSGNVNAAALLGETPGPGLARNIDLTNFFNAQGLAGGTGAAMSGLNNLNIVRLQQLDRQGIIDIGDLTPAGLLAANAHFSG